jgi:hypothetical protein
VPTPGNVPHHPSPKENRAMPDPTPEAAQQNLNAIQTIEDKASTVYMNFCRMNLTPEEIVLSFGLNTQMQITEPIHISHRVVMNFYTAKRLLNLLAQAVAQHEMAFGQLELDAQRRVRAVPRASTPPSTLKPGPA